MQLGITVVAVLTISVCSWALAEAPKAIVDRMVLKVNDSAYTQREVELYFLVKAFLREDPALLVGANNWKIRLHNFKDDALVFEDSTRMSVGMIAIPAELQKKLKAIYQNNLYRPELDRLVVVDRDLEVAAYFLRTVERHIDNIDRTGQKRRFAMRQRGKKRGDLELRHFIFFYQDAEQYRLLRPRQFIESALKAK